MTRTFFCRKEDPEYAPIHDLVRSANEKAESLIRPGVRFCDLDKAARDLITEAGYGEYFNHRLGHSIGMQDHEPCLLYTSNMPLRMAGWFVNDVQRFVTSVEKIHTTFSEEPHISKPDNAITKKHYKGSIEFRNVSYQAEGCLLYTSFWQRIWILKDSTAITRRQPDIPG